MNINLIKTIAIAAGSFVAGAVISGKILYKKGKANGGYAVYEAGMILYPDFKQKMAEYAAQ